MSDQFADEEGGTLSPSSSARPSDTPVTPPASGHSDEYDPLDFEAVHVWFGLTYANYLVLPRTLLQSMPNEWQRQFVTCLKEMDEAMVMVPQASQYRVQAVGSDGKFTKDPVPHYNRGRTRVGA